jgi:transcriptional regulator with XRE-family HTH domain
MGFLIRAARKKAGMTQDGLAAALGDITTTCVSQWERGNRVPALKTLKRIADVCSVPPVSLLPAEMFSSGVETRLTPNEYQRLAMRTSDETLTPIEHLDNGLLGILGEGGEAADIFKKHRYQRHPLDKQHLVKELGDVCWYIAEAASAIGYDLETIMRLNIEKLSARYPDGFDPERSLHRQKGDI